MGRGVGGEPEDRRYHSLRLGIFDADRVTYGHRNREPITMPAEWLPGWMFTTPTKLQKANS